MPAMPDWSIKYFETTKTRLYSTLLSNKAGIVEIFQICSFLQEGNKMFSRCYILIIVGTILAFVSGAIMLTILKSFYDTFFFAFITTGAAL